MVQMKPKHIITIKIFADDCLRAEFLNVDDGTITDIWEASTISLFKMLLKKILPQSEYKIRKVKS